MSTKILPQEFYDNFAQTYDSTAKLKAEAQNITEAIKIFHKYNLDESGSILDIGCATGLLKDSLQGQFEYTGIDVSAQMLEHASSNRGYKTIHGLTEVVLPEIPDASYDFIFALSSLQFVEDIYPCLNHMYRIARQSILLSIDQLPDEFLSKSKIF